MGPIQMRKLSQYMEQVHGEVGNFIDLTINLIQL